MPDVIAFIVEDFDFATSFLELGDTIANTSSPS
jgi:hypothetical protein